MKTRKGPLLALTSALMAATSASSVSAWENPLENPYLEEPLEVCDQAETWDESGGESTTSLKAPVLDLRSGSSGVNRRPCPEP